MSENTPDRSHEGTYESTNKAPSEGGDLDDPKSPENAKLTERFKSEFGSRMEGNKLQLNYERGVNYRYTFETKPNSVEVIKEISLSIKKGEFVTIFGPNGCGKSTLLNLANNGPKNKTEPRNKPIKSSLTFKRARRLFWILTVRSPVQEI